MQSSSIKSNYHWQGELMHSVEIILQMKTKQSLFEKVQTEIEELHNYDVPEIIMIPLLNANASYLQWLEDETIDN